MPIRFGIILFLFISGWSAGGGAAELPRPIKIVLGGHRIPPGAYSLYVREVGKQEPVLAVNPEIPLNPASVIKIVPTLAALKLLGPAYRWKTEVYTPDSIKGGVLQGDILFKGYGDPHLVIEELRRILEELKRRGIREITGDLLIDHSYFQVPFEDPGAFDNKPYRTYNVMPNAFLVNFKTVYFHFYPNANGNQVTLHSEPELDGLKIDNRLRLRKRYCGGFQRGIAVSVPDGNVASHIIFSGRFPTGCRHYILSRSLLTHETYAFGAFKTIWQQLGGSIAGQVRTAVAPEADKPFLVWHSKPLSEVIRLINKFSNNVMSRQLLLTLGAELQEQPGTTEKGIRVIYDQLLQLGLDTRSLKIVNGSGLSREARVSASLLADILEHAWTIPYRPEFISSLSITGIDGTARNRLKHKAASGYAHIKTGTIDDVSAIAGYVHAKSGREYIVAGMLNYKQAHKGPGKELMNALVTWAYNL